MSDKPNQALNAPGADTIRVDRQYIREQASEALKTFFAPFSGVYSAAFGPITDTVPATQPKKAKSGSVKDKVI